MKPLVLIFTPLVFFLFASSCAKKVEPETTLSRGGQSLGDSNDPSLGFNDGSDDLAGLGDPLRGSFDETDPLAPRDPALSAFDDPLNVIRPFDPVFFGTGRSKKKKDKRSKI